MSDTDYPSPAYQPAYQPDLTPDLNAALAKAQGEMTSAKKDAKNAHFGSRYADMASVIDACRPLSAHGLAYVQFVGTQGALVTVTTVLRHVSGQVLDCGTLTARAKDEGPQSIGSVLTYLRRYSLMAAVGVGSADDDGQAGQGVPDEPPKAKRESPSEANARKQTHDPSWPGDQGRFFAQLAALDISKEDADGVCTRAGRPRPSQMPQGKRDAVLAYLASDAGKAAVETHNALKTEVK